MKKYAQYALMLLLVFQMRAEVPQHSEQKISPAAIIGKGLMTTACYGAAAITPYLLSLITGKSKKRMLARGILAYTMAPLLYSAYAINKPLDKSAVQKPSTKTNAYIKLGFCGLNVFSAVSFMFCTGEHLLKGENYNNNDDLEIAHHLVAITALLGTAYQLYTSGRQSLKGATAAATEASASSKQASKEQKK